MDSESAKEPAKKDSILVTTRILKTAHRALMAQADARGMKFGAFVRMILAERASRDKV